MRRLAPQLPLRPYSISSTLPLAGPSIPLPRASKSTLSPSRLSATSLSPAKCMRRASGRAAALMMMANGVRPDVSFSRGPGEAQPVRVVACLGWRGVYTELPPRMGLTVPKPSSPRGEPGFLRSVRLALRRLTSLSLLFLPAGVG